MQHDRNRRSGPTPTLLVVAGVALLLAGGFAGASWNAVLANPAQRQRSQEVLPPPDTRLLAGLMRLERQLQEIRETMGTELMAPRANDPSLEAGLESLREEVESLRSGHVPAPRSLAQRLDDLAESIAARMVVVAQG